MSHHLRKGGNRSAALIAMWANPIYRAQQVARIRASRTPEFKAKMVLIAKEPAVKAKQAAKKIISWHDAGIRQRRVVGMRAATRPPRTRRSCMKQSRTLREQYRNGRKVAVVYRHFRYRGIHMRSSWEVAFAKWLDMYGIQWVYERCWFAMPKGSYRPDFYLPAFDLYIETKGWLKPGLLWSLRALCRREKLHLCVLVKDHLERLGVEL